MFIPNQTAMLYRRLDVDQSVYAEYSFAPGVLVDCAMTQLNLKVSKTSVRADSSASRGRAEEELGNARLLFPPNIQVQEGDIVQVDGYVIEITTIFPRKNVLGHLDHYQVDFRKGALPS